MAGAGLLAGWPPWLGELADALGIYAALFVAGTVPPAPPPSHVCARPPRFIPNDWSAVPCLRRQGECEGRLAGRSQVAAGVELGARHQSGA